LKNFSVNMRDFFGIGDPAEISAPKFKGIYGINGYNDVEVDSAKMLSSWNWMLNYSWHFDITNGDTIALIQSPDTLYNRLITGVRDISGAKKYVILGFPLYFMKPPAVRAFLQKALLDIGTGITETKKGRLKHIGIGKPQPTLFSKTTKFTVMLPENTNISVGIFDVSGRKIKDIYKGKITKGKHIFNWNGKNVYGEETPSAIYFIVVDTPGKRISRKVTYLR